MRHNLGDADRVARLFLAAGPAVVFRHFSGAVELLVAGVAIYLLATSVAGWCPLYAVLRVSTKRSDDAVP